MATELAYTHGRGLAEIIRMTLCASKIQFTEKHVHNRKEFMAMWPELLFSQLPLLRIDGMKIVQMRAIVRYVARKGNLLGGSDQEQTRVDELFEGTRDMLRSIVWMYIRPVELIIPEIKKDLSRYLPIYAKIIDSNVCGFLVGNSLTIADLGLLENMLATFDYFPDEAGSILSPYPSLVKFHEKMQSLEVVQHYIQQIRRPPNNETYGALVRETFEL